MREFDLLQHVFRANPHLPAGVTIPPGDDMGAIQIGEHTVLITVDQVADGVHVDLAQTPLEKIGRKAITRNLSDVAAMAAQPLAAVAAASLPRDLTETRATALFDAIRATAQAFDCPLIGGDVSVWNAPLLLSVTVLAMPVGDAPPVLRSGAKVGDGIFVSGQLGGSLVEIDGYTHHLDFTPRLELARQLVMEPAVALHSMIDLSDGLLGDLRHLCQASGVSAMVDRDALPISSAASVLAGQTGKPAWVHAMTDGEDYELLFTASGSPSGEVTRIGSVVETANDQVMIQLHDAQGQPVIWQDDWGRPGGWEHVT